MVPTNIEQNELAQEVLEPVLKDDKMIGAQANNTYGEFMGDLERSLNFEVVTQVDFDPTEMTRSLIEAGKKYNQDAVFISKVVAPGTANARPGGEIYFRDRQGVDFAQQVTQILKNIKLAMIILMDSHTLLMLDKVTGLMFKLAAQMKQLD